MRQTMKPEIERQLMRLLHGELPEGEAARWRGRLEAEPDLAASYAALRATWSELETGPPVAVSPEFGRSFWRRLEQERSTSILDLWRLAPAWNRALAAAALAIGVGIGALAGGGAIASSDETVLGESEPTLAETYWAVIADTDIDGVGGRER